MRVRKTLTILLIITLVAWGIETIFVLYRNVSMPSQIKRQAEGERRVLMLEFRKRELKLNVDYNRKKYLATGETVYDRVFNAKNQTIVELIQKMVAESLPKGWSCEVRVEEFTHFILLVYLPHNVARVEGREVVSYMIAIVKHCSSYLSDVAVFDRMHKSYLFFDNDTLKHLEKEGSLTEKLLREAKQQGESFTRLNSKTIQCDKYESHLFLPVEITGPSGVVTCLALLDTGASITTLSYGAISKTGADNLAIAPKRSFNTANGWMSCPVVRREVNIGGFRRNIEVAVNQRDEVNLLGMNYFEGLQHVVDFSNSCIYVWEK